MMISAYLLIIMFQKSGYALDYSCFHSNNWLVNKNSHRNAFFGNVLTDITGSGPSARNTVWSVTFNRIPNYDRAFTSSDVSTLNSRPKRSTDFPTGATTAVSGNSYVWGQNIGYSTRSCNLGYWPPGPSCPTASSGSSEPFTLTPARETSSTGCYGGLAEIARLVNGVALYGWSDALSYQSRNVWHNLAAKWEVYDLDVCGGHAANGDYHHHFQPNCLAEVLGDTGTGHSPLYGFGIDGFPIYGPYQAAGVLAKSCWFVRDYSSSVVGCSGGARTCKMVDEFDYTRGTTTSGVSSGPSLTGTQTTQSGNSLSAASGIYYEDYYYNKSCSGLGSAYLDSYNGHSHDDYGWHYHFTIDSSGTPVFPYSLGPKFYGCISSTCYSAICASQSCTATTTSRCGTSLANTSAAACLTQSTSSQTYSPTATPVGSPIASPTSNPISPSNVPSLLPTRSPTTSPTAPPTSSPSVGFVARASLSLAHFLATSLSASSFDDASQRAFISVVRNVTSSSYNISILSVVTSSTSLRLLASGITVTYSLSTDLYGSGTVVTDATAFQSSVTSSISAATSSGTFLSQLRSSTSPLLASVTSSSVSTSSVTITYISSLSPTPSPTAGSNPSSSSGLSQTAYIIIAVVVGSVVIASMIGIILYFLSTRKDTALPGIGAAKVVSIQ